MNNSRMRLIFCALSFIWVLTVSAQKLPTEASALEFEFEVIVAEKQKPIKTLNGHYLNRLDSVRETIQSTGDLEGVLGVGKEREAIEETGTPLVNPPESEPALLKESRAIYKQSRIALEKSIELEIAPERKAVISKLADLKQNYTQEARLEDALAVEALAQRISSETPEPIVANATMEKFHGDIEIKAQIDGVSFLKLRGNEIWFDHTKGSFAKPGLHSGEFPTYINTTIEWMPEWTGNVTAPFDAGSGLPTSEPMPDLDIRNTEGRGYAEVVEQPTKDNDFTATITLRDGEKDRKAFLGSDWIGFRVSW